jgi:hypothetical protein
MAEAEPDKKAHQNTNENPFDCIIVFVFSEFIVFNSGLKQFLA